MALEKSPASTCRQHPEARAGWRCLGCEAPLCPQCVVARRAQTVDMLCCASCGDTAEPLLVHRSHIPLARRLRDTWRQPFSRHNLALLLSVSALVAFFQVLTEKFFILVRIVPAMLGAGVFWSWFFHHVRSVSQGRGDVDGPDFTEGFRDFLLPALRGVVLTAMVWMPSLLYSVLVGEWKVRQQLHQTLGDPMFFVAGRTPPVPEAVKTSFGFWFLAVCSHAFLPMMLMLSAASHSLVAALNPFEILRGLRRMGRDYLLTLGVLGALGGGLLVVRLFNGWLLTLDFLVILNRWGGQLLELLVLALMAHVLGLLLYTRGDEIHYGEAREYVIPVLGDATPSTQLGLQALPPPEPEAEAESARTPAKDTRLAELTAAVEARDVTRAVALYTELRLPVTALPAAVHLFVGQASAVQGDYALSTRALEAAADAEPQGPLAPRALVLLARVRGERLQDTASALQVYRFIVERYPDTEAARFAQARLGASPAT